MTRGRLERSAIGVLLGLLLSASVAFALDPRGAWSASGGGGVIPVPPWGLKPPATPSPPTLGSWGNLPILVQSTVSERFVLVLRSMDGRIIDAARVRTRDVVVLRAPEGVALRLDVLPLDGVGVPVIGVPVAAGVAVAVGVGGR